ncbi:PH domain-containing protein [uncultured Flavobacterium sp.]|uniref:PH domain-containing protein n=1 Tax=uncultured Flavobacterium sp. TaxID=165435 RepID=UPI0025F5EDE6|nr:PH domain-containing protein [uncultured Flavobacterium sp.]
MEDFTNETIDTTNLPRFEEVELTPLQASYINVVRFNIAVTFSFIAIGAGAGFYFIEELHPYWLPVAITYSAILLLTIIIATVRFRNSGFAFRKHDVIYRSGAIALTTTIIPYNRVQHVAIEEGWLSRKLGLAEVDIFTAGGQKSDIQIPGIDKGQAERIKQLLMGKILKEEADEQ